MIVGGWSFVFCAYGIAYGGLLFYAISLWHRIDKSHMKSETRHDDGNHT